MKMIFAVIRDKDSYAAIGALSEKNIGVTKLASSGGFLREGNTTLMIGVEDSRVEEVMGILRELCEADPDRCGRTLSHRRGGHLEL